MKRISSVLLLFLIIPQLAWASKEAVLRALIDDFSYSITVEWDQKDKPHFN
jgi:hypothetical protein